MVWVGTARAMSRFVLVSRQEPHPVSGYHEVRPEPEGVPVRARFVSPHVAKYGSHEGCGCGFNTESLDVGGFDRSSTCSARDLVPFLGALTDEERAEFSAEQASRERLAAAVVEASIHGAVEVYACWSGDEAEAPLDVEDVTASHFAEQLAPLRERVLYRVARVAREPMVEL